MLDSPEFEPEFYADQIRKMEKRYEKIFKKWKLSWTKYYNEVKSKLFNKQYWIWTYLCGFENFVKINQKSEVTETMLEKDSLGRIKRILKDYFKIKNYIESL